MSFSVLLSLYKKENPEYFDTAMKSIWDDQSLKPDEIVLVQDGPLTDLLYAVVSRWKNILEDKLIVVDLKENMSFAKALNIGLKHCSYDLVARMDTDDISLPNRFEIQYRYMKENQNTAVCGTFIEEFSQDYSKKIELPIESKSIYQYIKLRNPIAHPSVMYRKSTIEKVGAYPENLRLGQDFGLWSILISKGYILENIPEVLVKMRINQNFMERRGWESFKYEALTIKLQYKIGLIGSIRAVKALTLRFILRMSPNIIKKFLYKNLK
jgi:glycosyltransferase involved in cell wall biosynthesis